MKLRRVDLQNVRGIERLTLELADANGNLPSAVVLVGDNGSGKTTVLEAIGSVFSKFAGGSPTSTQSLVGRRKTQLAITLDIALEDEDWFSEEPSWDGHGEFPKGLQVVRVHGASKPTPPMLLKADKNNQAMFLDRCRQRSPVIYLDSKRFLPSVAVTSTTKPGQYVKAGGGAIDSTMASSRSHGRFAGVKQWLIDKYSQWSQKQVQQQRFEEERFFEEFWKKIEVFLVDKKFVECRDYDVWFAIEGQEYQVSIDELSAGEQVLFLLFFEIWGRGSDHDIVLIDELEAHLHPSWQVRVLPALLQAFPTCQFIVTTHEPLIVDGVEPWDAYKLPEGRKLGRRLSST